MVPYQPHVVLGRIYHLWGVKKLIVAVGGASGSFYTSRLFEKLGQYQDQCHAIGIVMSRNAVTNWELEIGEWTPDAFPFTFYSNDDFGAPFASGSAKYETMIVCPCSMGLLGRIAAGTSQDLITRAADVILKERRRLILVARETPLSLIHLNNMTTVTQAGAIVCPAIPSFYTKPESINDLADTVIDRILDLAGFEIQTDRWSGG